MLIPLGKSGFFAKVDDEDLKLGSFETFEEACLARQTAVLELHGEFANLQN